MRFLNKGNGVIGKVRIKLYFILVYGLFTSAFNYEWNIDLIDRGGADYSSIDIDSLGHPHIAYFTGWQQPSLKYAYKNDTNWYIGTIAESCGLWLSLKLDKKNQPKISHTSYDDYLHGRLFYSYLQNDTWFHILVDTLLTCMYSSLALDSLENPCISYLSGENHYDDTLKVEYAHLNDSIWDIQNVNSRSPTTDFFEFKSTSISIDDIGRPHISFGCDGFESATEFGFASVCYAFFDDSLWIGRSFGIAGTFLNISFDKTFLILDSNSRAHITFSMGHSYPSCEKYLFYSCFLPDSDWFRVQLPDSLADTPALELDSLNRAHIAYISGNKLMYAIWDGNTWTFDTITTGNFSGDVSLKLDQNDNPHICFFSNELYYAYGSPTGIEEIKNQNAISLMSEIYPNPVKSVLRVRGPFSEKSIKIFNSLGRLIKEITTPSARNDEVVEISLKGISPGIYFLRLDKKIKKFLVVR